MNEKIINKKLELLWIDKESGQRFPAGAAFYHEDKDEYRLKIDDLSDDKMVFLRPVHSENGEVKYRVEVVLKKNAKFLRHSPIGMGHSSPQTGKYIFLDLGPYSRSLVLDMGTKRFE